MLEKLEQLAESYAKLKDAGEPSHEEMAKLAVAIVDSMSSPSFTFPVANEALSNAGKTSYTYQQNATYPALFDFLGELLHTTVPLEVKGAKFGPGEVLVSKGNKPDADVELALSTKELQNLVHARRSEISSKHEGAASP
jgi:hypothetical protein